MGKPSIGWISQRIGWRHPGRMPNCVVPAANILLDGFMGQAEAVGRREGAASGRQSAAWRRWRAMRGKAIPGR